jgi:hypothetical protein
MKTRVRRKEVGAGGREVGAKSAPSRRGVGLHKCHSSPVFMQVLCVPVLKAGKTHIRGKKKLRSIVTMFRAERRRGNGAHNQNP